MESNQTVTCPNHFQDYMSFVTPESPYCIKDGIPMVLFERGNTSNYLCGHCGQVTERRNKLG